MNTMTTCCECGEEAIVCNGVCMACVLALIEETYPNGVCDMCLNDPMFQPTCTFCNSENSMDMKVQTYLDKQVAEASMFDKVRWFVMHMFESDSTRGQREMADWHYARQALIDEDDALMANDRLCALAEQLSEYDPRS